MNKIIVFFSLLIIGVSCNKGYNSTAIKTFAQNLLLEKEEAKNHFVVPVVPDEIVFAGEKVSLKDLDLKERMDNELVVNNFWHSNTILMMKRTNRWFPMIKEILRKQQVPEDMAYVALIESGLRNVVSPAGARGFWQFMESTGKEYNLVIDKEVDERYHVEKSTYAACQYLKRAYNKFGTWTLAAAAYNRGMKGIENDLKEQNVENFFDLSLNNETARYVFRLFAVKLIFENPTDYGFYLEDEDLYPPYITKDIEVITSIENIHEWAKEQGISTKILRKLNPWIIGQKLQVKEGQKFIVKIPKDSEQLGLFKG